MSHSAIRSLFVSPKAWISRKRQTELLTVTHSERHFFRKITKMKFMLIEKTNMIKLTDEEKLNVEELIRAFKLILKIYYISYIFFNKKIYLLFNSTIDNFVSSPDCGAIASFHGTTRNASKDGKSCIRLEYSVQRSKTSKFSYVMFFRRSHFHILCFHMLTYAFVC